MRHPAKWGQNGRGSRSLFNTLRRERFPTVSEGPLPLPRPSSGRRLLPGTSADDSPVWPAADDGPSIIRSVDDGTAVIGSAIPVIWSANDRTAVIGCAIADDGPVGSTAHDRSTLGVWSRDEVTWIEFED